MVSPDVFYDDSVNACVSPDEKTALLSLRRNALKAALAHPLQFKQCYETRAWTEQVPRRRAAAAAARRRARPAQEITTAGLFRRSICWWDEIRRQCLKAMSEFSPVCLVDPELVQKLLQLALAKGRPQTRRLSSPVRAEPHGRRRRARPARSARRERVDAPLPPQAVKLEVSADGAKLVFPNKVHMPCVEPSFRAPVSFGVCAVCSNFMEVTDYDQQVTNGIVHCKSCTPTQKQLDRTKTVVDQLAKMDSFPLVRAIFRSDTDTRVSALMLPIWEVLLLTSSGSLIFPEMANVANWPTLAARPAEILLELGTALLKEGVTPSVAPPLEHRERRELLVRDLTRL